MFQNPPNQMHFLQKISNDFNFWTKKYPKIKPSENFKRPKY